MALDHAALLAYLQQSQGLNPAELDHDTPLFSSGLLDSFSMVDLIMFIEGSAGIQVAPTDVTLDNLDSLARILDYAQRTASGS
jgi:acyl carrier protein